MNTPYYLMGLLVSARRGNRKLPLTCLNYDLSVFLSVQEVCEVVSWILVDVKMY